MNLLSANGFAVEAGRMLERAADISGVSNIALHYLKRAADLWLVDTSNETVEAVLGIRQRYDAISRELSPEAFLEHHDVELSVHLALNLLSFHDENDALRMLPCVTEPRATVMHRLSAAYHLLNRYSFIPWSQQTVDAVWQIVAKLEATDNDELLLKELCAVQYYLHFTDEPEIGLEHALSARERIVTSGSGPQRHLMGVMVAPQPWLN